MQSMCPGQEGCSRHAEAWLKGGQRTHCHEELMCEECPRAEDDVVVSERVDLRHLELPTPWSVSRKRGNHVQCVRASQVQQFIASRKSLPKSAVKWASVNDDNTATVCEESDSRAELFLLKEWYDKAVVPRTRPDKAASKQERKFQVEQVVKASLKKRLRATELKGAIESRVVDISKATHRASLLLQHIVLSALDNGERLPVLDTTFYYNLLISGTKAPEGCDDEGSCSDEDVSDDEEDVYQDCDDVSLGDYVPENLKKPVGGLCPIGNAAILRAEYSLSAIPAAKRHFGDSNTIVMAATAMKTSVSNTIVHSFEKRLCRYVKTWCAMDKSSRGEWYPVFLRIVGWREDGGKDPPPLMEAAKEFVKAERLALGDPLRVSEAWLKQHPRAVLSAFRRWLSFFERVGAKQYSVVPSFKIRAHFLRIDTVTLFGIMKEGKLYDKNLKAFKADSQNQWRRVFTLTGLSSLRYVPTGLVLTDGVSLNVHFRRPMSISEVKAKEDALENAKAKRAEAELNKMSRLAARDEKERVREAKKREQDQKRIEAERQKEEKERYKELMNELKESDPAEYKRIRAKHLAELKAAREAKPKRVKKVGTEAVAVNEYVPPALQRGEVAVDPGGSNLFYVVGLGVDGYVKRMRFTKGRYSMDSGIRKQQKNKEWWNKRFTGSNDSIEHLYKKSAKTSSMVNFMEHVERLSRVYGELWAEYTKKRWARSRMDVYIRKPQAIDRFLEEVEAAYGEIKVVHYGGAKWSPSGKGRETMPVCSARRRWVLRFGSVVNIVDEYLTTQCCYKCGARTRSVREKDGENASKEVRGLRCCESSKCGTFTKGKFRGALVDRDMQGAMNIMACGKAGKDRPLHLTRQGAGDKLTGWVLVRCKRRNTCLGGVPPCRVSGVESPLRDDQSYRPIII